MPFKIPENNSMMKVFRTRELLILALRELFSNRVDFTYIGDDDRDTQIWIMDEENDSTENSQAFPRIVIKRESTNFMGLLGIGHGSPANFSMGDTTSIMKEGITHNFTIEVKSFSSSICETLGFIIGYFFKFYEKDILEFDEERSVSGIECSGFSKVTRLSEANKKGPLYSCQIPLIINDCDIITLEDKRSYADFKGLKVEFSFVCEEEEEE